MTRLALLLLAAAVVVPAGAARAERAWVKDELTVWVRSGPGNKYRNFRAIKTGDTVEILSRTKDWTQIKAGDSEGWIPVGFLQPEPPARIRLERHEAETADQRRRFTTISGEVSELRTQNAELSERQQTLEAELARIRDENIELRAGARWPEWIAGASILVVGSLLGMFVQWSSGRRNTRRIRL
jgi:SH3 domain protein